ncbi:uncharacterized protein [Temnothorax longispinosus]|uniref:uncharacterized protein n=1 Tax=Temnothorax longispinosus TaxID=300112 RepID=UPI003A98FFDA
MSLDQSSMLSGQHELFGRISRAVENLRKMGQANITLSTVEHRIRILDDLWAKFESQHDLIRACYKDLYAESEYAKSDLLTNAEIAYVHQRGVLSDQAKRLQPAPASTPPAASEQGGDRASRTSLPRIQLREFSGSYEDWPSFRDLFKSVIGEQSSISKVERLHYLRSCLKGPAENLIKSLTITGDNYDRAWDILCTHYEIRGADTLQLRHVYRRGEDESRYRRRTQPRPERRHVRRQCAGEHRKAHRLARHGPFNHLVVELFDPRTRLEWESSSGDSFEPPTHATLMTFINKRILTLNAANPKNTKPASEPTRSAKTYLARRSEPSQCPLCNGEHSLMGCPDFKAKPASERKTVAETNKLCFNCLGNHLVAKCQSTRNCMTCNSRHHTMLHDAYSSEPPPAAEVSALSAVGRADDRKAILLATARVIVADRHGKPHEVRALIDQGSEVSIVSESLVQRLHLPRSRTRVSIFGIGGSQSGSTRGKVSMSLTSRTTGATLTAVAFVLPRPSLYQGSAITCSTTWPHLQGLPLADPLFAANDPVELLLGAEVCSTILEDGLRRGKPQTPIAQKTILGWILSGGCGAASLLGHHRSLQAHSAFVRLAPEKRECERLSVCAHERTSAGRCAVRRPVSSPPKNHAETHKPVVDAIVVQTELCTAGGFPARKGAAVPENLLRPRTITRLTPEKGECERLAVRTLKRTSAGRHVVQQPVSSHPRNLAAPRKPVDDATAVHTEVREPYTAGGLPLHKWATNSEDGLVEIPQKYRLQHALELSTTTWLSTLTRHARDPLSLSAAPLLRRSEASVTLHWATDHVSRWKPFMNHRVSLIQRTRHEAQWRHIPGRDNPANCSSRGIAPSELIGNPLRWTGPRWLPESRTWWPDESDEISDAELPKRKVVTHSAVKRIERSLTPSVESPRCTAAFLSGFSHTFLFGLSRIVLFGFSRLPQRTTPPELACTTCQNRVRVNRSHIDFQPRRRAPHRASHRPYWPVSSGMTRRAGCLRSQT